MHKKSEDDANLELNANSLKKGYNVTPLNFFYYMQT